MKNLHYVYLHSIGLTQRDLFLIFENSTLSAKEIFDIISTSFLQKFIKDTKRVSRIIENLQCMRFDKIEAILKKLSVDVIVYGDELYPQSLQNIPHTPFILYVRWVLPQTEMFWVVGTRKISSYGKSVIEKIVPDVSQVFPIVSGWAAGCDSLAHKTALQSWNKTVVVIWTWIDQVYPSSNAALFEEIIKNNGALISIFPVWEPGNPYNFPIRNEIVVGLSKWILVVEAQEKSWSMITAALCLDLWKDLFTVPWNIFHSESAWTNILIQKWEAKCVVQSNDILEEYESQVKQSRHVKIIPNISGKELEVYSLISREEQTIDMLIESLDSTVQEVTLALTLLELKKCIKKNIQGKYILS